MSPVRMSEIILTILSIFSFDLSLESSGFIEIRSHEKCVKVTILLFFGDIGFVIFLLFLTSLYVLVANVVGGILSLLLKM